MTKEEFFNRIHALVTLKHLCEYGGLTNEQAYFAGKIKEMKRKWKANLDLNAEGVSFYVDVDGSDDWTPVD